MVYQSMHISVVERIAQEVRKQLEGKESGHDWWHTDRVWHMARHLAREEGAHMFVVELAALLHDMADWKFHGGDETIGLEVARELLCQYDVPPEVIDHVCDIIASLSFKGAGVQTDMRTLEGKVVQDADRLDALGAIGIARTFAYGGYKGRLIHDPGKRPVLHETKEEYIQNDGPTVNHFYEKLLLLKDRMNTVTGKKIAAGRHQFMEQFLENFFQEWEGKL